MGSEGEAEAASRSYYNPFDRRSDGDYQPLTQSVNIWLIRGRTVKSDQIVCQNTRRRLPLLHPDLLLPDSFHTTREREAIFESDSWKDFNFEMEDKCDWINKILVFIKRCRSPRRANRSASLTRSLKRNTFSYGDAAVPWRSINGISRVISNILLNS